MGDNIAMETAGAAPILTLSPLGPTRGSSTSQPPRRPGRLTQGCDWRGGWE